MTQINYNLSKTIGLWVGVLTLVGMVVKTSVWGTETYDNLINGQKETKDLIITKTNQIEEHQRRVEAKLFRDSSNAEKGDNELKSDIHRIFKILKVNQ